MKLRASHLGAALLGAAVLALALPAAAFVRTVTRSGGHPLFWEGREIHYAIHEATPADLAQTEVIEAVTASFAAWEGVSCSDFRFVYDGLTSTERVGFDRSPEAPNSNLVRFWDDARDWPYERGIIAVTTTSFEPRTGEIRDSDIELNAVDFDLSVSESRVRTDVQNTVTHEVGHLLGFDHTEDTAATMFGAAPEGELLKRSLGQDDVDGICAVYPNGEETPMVTEDPLENPLTRPKLDQGGCRQSAPTPGPLLCVGIALAAASYSRRRRRR